MDFFVYKMFKDFILKRFQEFYRLVQKLFSYVVWGWKISNILVYLVVDMNFRYEFKVQ